MALTMKNPSITSYFSSLSPLTRKLFDETEELKRSEMWENMSNTEKENLMNKFFISNDNEVLTAAAEDSEDLPKLKVNCGEKIVVDFENEDGWTWRDEHSGPFSWMTRSQQDLTLDEIYKDIADLKEKRGPKSPLMTSDNHEQGFRAFEEPAFSTAGNELSEIEAAFQKFGISIPTDDNPLDDVIHNTNITTEITDQSLNATGYSDNAPNRAPSDISNSGQLSDDSGCRDVSDWTSCSTTSSPEHTQKKSARHTLNNILKWPWGRKKNNQKAESSVMSLPLTADTTQAQDVEGLVSPVFENDDSQIVITSQPEKSTNLPLETYDNMTSQYDNSHVTSTVDEPFVDILSYGQHETYDNVPELSYTHNAPASDESFNSHNAPVSSDLSSSFNVPYETGNVVVGDQPQATGDQRVFIEPVGESSDVSPDVTTDENQEKPSLDVKSGFAFLDNW